MPAERHAAVTGPNTPGSEAQRFTGCRTDSVVCKGVSLARLTARFSLSDFPDFLAMCCRGDLSAMDGPLGIGGLIGPGFLTVRADTLTCNDVRPQRWQALICRVH